MDSKMENVDAKCTTNGGMKSNKVICNNIEETRENANLESNLFKNDSNRKKTKEVEEIESKNYKMKCFDDQIQNVIKYIGDEVFCHTKKKIIELDKTEDSGVKALKYDIVNTLLDVLVDSTELELKTIEETIKVLVVPDSLKRFVVDKHCITQNYYLGEGFSSVVFSAVLDKDGARTKVAVKNPRRKEFEKMMINEATVLSQFDHKNIVKMLAFIKDGPQIVFELMEQGNLVQIMERIHLSDRNIFKILIDIATGMEYLHGKQYLHRDIDCGNVFINVRQECKIGDFGFCVYVGDCNGLYEEKGMEIISLNLSPETSRSGIFRFQSDVWLMGILILELYHLLCPRNRDSWLVLASIKNFLKGEAKLHRPSRCPKNLFQFVTNRLLNRNFEQRPDFITIRKKMEDYLRKCT